MRAQAALKTHYLRQRTPTLDREVAIKVLPPALASSSTSYERFRREAIAASGQTVLRARVTGALHGQAKE